MGYLRPHRLEDALAALSAGPRVILAGGTDHFPARVSHTPDEDILDISALPGLRAIERRGDGWWIPCGATWSDLIEADLPPAFDALVSAARQVGGVQVQNAGTLVGNLCNASPAADGVPCLIALDAKVEIASLAGQRTVPIEAFVLGARNTALRAGEMALGVHVRSTEGVASVFMKLGSRKYLVISIAMVAVAARIEDGRVAEARVAVGACGPRAERLPELEASLVGQIAARPDLDPAHFACLSPIDDIRAPAAYRRMAAIEITRRAVMALA